MNISNVCRFILCETNEAHIAHFALVSKSKLWIFRFVHDKTGSWRQCIHGASSFYVCLCSFSFQRRCCRLDSISTLQFIIIAIATKTQTHIQMHWIGTQTYERQTLFFFSEWHKASWNDAFVAWRRDARVSSIRRDFIQCVFVGRNYTNYFYIQTHTYAHTYIVIFMLEISSVRERIVKT